MKQISGLCVVVCIFFFLGGCGVEEVTLDEAEKTIRTNEPWEKTYEFKILEGQFIPKTVSFEKDDLLKKTYFPLYSYLQKSGYLQLERIYGNKKHGPAGERYLTDIYKITVTDKFKKMAHETTTATDQYGVYPAGRDRWKKKQVSFLVHKVNLKIIDYRFMKINSMSDLRVDSSSTGVCDVNVNFSYEKKFTDLGKIMGEYPGGRLSGPNPNTDSVLSDNICLVLSNDKWQVKEGFSPK